MYGDDYCSAACLYLRWRPANQIRSSSGARANPREKSLASYAINNGGVDEIKGLHVIPGIQPDHLTKCSIIPKCFGK